MTLTSNSASGIISQEFQVKQCALAARPTAENLFPVCESDVDVLQREVILWQLLETQNDGILRGILNPGSLHDQRRTNL